ncbi:plasma membrane snare protein-like protein [Sphaerosporella brunnea]|uniref:Plasma membrane snare protein-like protein n=1 Tax=Sphaerosporella brunnea TaxID=1250544 RepID=A0A5J5EXZ6_9PEZI|nr:plasma membrane snare protein-like protein [Sphaerosporella brunnea]
MGLFSKKDKSSAKEEEARNELFGNRGGSSSTNPYAAPPPAQSQNPTPGNNREALFGQRPQAAAPQGYGGYAGGSGYGKGNEAGGYGHNVSPPNSNSAGGYGQPSSYGGYGQDPDRQLTAEEEEEEDVNAIKQQIRFTKQESVSSTRNALRIASQAEETGRNTLTRLGQQGERLYNTEKNLDVAAAHNVVAAEKARELKTLNRSMFAVHMNNPLRSKSRAEAEEQKILDRHQNQREERERTRQFGYESRDRVGRALNQNGKPGGGTKASLAERSKYQFEADESDDEKEKEIEHNLDQLQSVTGRLKNLAMATGEEVDRQNQQINQIMGKSDNVDNQITITHHRIKKIH